MCGGDDAWRHEFDLAVWIALEDRRAGAMAALNDGAGSSAKLDPGASVVAWGGPSGAALAGDLIDLARGWIADGAPTALRYRHQLLPADHTASLAASDWRWAIRRADHTQLTAL